MCSHKILLFPRASNKCFVLWSLMIEDTFSGSGVGEVTDKLTVDREECSQ